MEVWQMRGMTLAPALIGLFGITGALANEKFGLEVAETRPFRNADVARAAEARAASGGHHHGHNHAGHSHAGHSHAGHAHAGAGHEHGIETENLFGFTLGSDTEHTGAKGVAIESIGRFGKRSSGYSALGQKMEFAFGLTDNFSASVALLGDYHRVKEKPAYAGMVEEVRSRYLFNGFGGEVRYRVLDRTKAPFGLTFHAEPSIAFSDELTGLKGIKYGSENKIIFDKELLPEKLFGAINLLHEMEIVKEKGAPVWERSTKIGASLALTYQVMPKVFLGAEARYQRAYEGLSFKAYLGDAWYIGPTVSARIGDRAWMSLAYAGLVGGKAKGSQQKYDLDNFERHQVRLKVGMEF
jgi:hypothetical protein